MGYSNRDSTYAGRQYPVSRVVQPRRAGLLSSFRFASEGIVYALRTQRNFRIHLAITGLVVAVGMWLELSALSWALLALTVGGVLVTEVFNTAAERLVDLVSPDYHPLAKQVKDLMAGAVLIAAVASIIVGVFVLGPPLVSALGWG